MTVVRARQLSARWLAVAATALVVRLALVLVGVDLLDLPLSVGMCLAFALSMKHTGWAEGYRARLAADTEVS